MDTTTQILFEKGKDAFLQGDYRISITFLQMTMENLPKSSREGGDVLLWLVNAYQANNQSDEAIALCRELLTHPFPRIGDTARRQLYILEAPKLQRPKEWLTEIPNLDALDPSQSRYLEAKAPSQKKELSADDFEDLSRMETKDNQFLFLALVVGCLGLVIWSVLFA